MDETVRKVFHMFNGILIAGIIYFLEPIFFQFLCLGVAPFLFYLRSRVKNNKKSTLTDFCLKHLGRKNDVGDGALYYLLGCFIVSLIFEKNIAALSILVLGISDGFATIVGIHGTHKIFKKKTLEGSTAFFISTLIIVSFFYNFWIGLIASLIITPVELFSFVDDNLSIPIIFSITIKLITQFL